MLQIQHIEFLLYLTMKRVETWLYVPCCIATVPFIVLNPFRLTRNLQGMTVNNIQLLIGVRGLFGKFVEFGHKMFKYRYTLFMF